MLTGLTLPEAIRKGATMVPQAHAALFDFAGPQILGACAIGAAVLGATGITDRKDLEKIDNTNSVDTFFPCLMNDADEWLCPVCGEGSSHDVFNAIAHLNDDEHWTREQIADYCEQQGWL